MYEINVPLLQQAEAPVWGELCMAGDHKGECDVAVKSSQHSPQQVSYHYAVLVLTPAVVSMEMDILLAEPMYFKEVMEHADD